jgi:CBS domain-containing protein
MAAVVRDIMDPEPIEDGRLVGVVTRVDVLGALAA